MKKLMMTIGALVATGLTAYAEPGISSFAPEVWFRFDDKSVSGYQQNEGTLGSAVSFSGSYSTIGMDRGGATYVKTSGGYGVHSYSPWCHEIPLGDEFTVALRLQATNEANRILFCLGALQGDNEALMLTTKDAQYLQLVVVKGTEVKNEAWIRVDDVTAFNTYVIRYENGQVSVNVNGTPDACCSVSYKHTSGVFQLLGGYNKQTTMPEYFHGCGVVDNSTGTVTEPYTANVIDDFCIWTTRQISTDEISQYAQGLIPSSYYHMVEYVCADGTTMSRHIGAEGIITADTETISNGNWYVVENSVSRKMIRVVGSAHLILCDGAKLTVNDDKQPGIALTDDHELTIYGQTKGTGELVAISEMAGIGGGYMFDSFYPPRRSCGKLTINGGKVTAQGGGSSVGIGGYSNGKGGSITINGGTVTATGGSGGIGNGAFASGGTVTINGGTVKAAGVDFGAGINAVVTINGGNVIASSMSTAPVNGEGRSLHKVTLDAPKGGASVFNGLGGYGLRDVVPVGGKYYFYLPDGSYRVSYETDDANGRFSFDVNGQDVVCPFEGYTKVDYIESDGGEQYIDTEYVHTATTKVECVVSMPEGQPKSWAAVFGARNGSFQRNAFVFFAKVGDDANQTCYNRSGVEDRGGPFFWGRKVSLTCDSQKACWNYDADHSNSIEPTGTSDQGVNTMFIFNLNTAGAAAKRPDQSPGAMKLYSFRIYEGETLVHDFVPRVRDADLAVGLYDLAATGSSKAFYTNAGRGMFRVSSGKFAVVTVGDHPHTTAAWTYGDGSVTNALTEASFMVRNGTENVTVIFTPDPSYGLASGKFVHQLGTVNADVTLTDVPKVAPMYLDADGIEQKLPDNVEFVTAATSRLEDGHWYVVEGRVKLGALEVSGSAHLVLLDGCELTVNGGIFVPSSSAITIYGQRSGTGRLNAIGDNGTAGIGGRYRWDGSYGDYDCGSVTINGGVVTAEGSIFFPEDPWLDFWASAAAIGGSATGSGGTVTVNGGRVIANTRYQSAGIGGGFANDGSLNGGGSGGRVMIRGGTVTSRSSYVSGIGGGLRGATGEVTILGGSIDASIQGNVQKNGAGTPLHKVTLELPPFDYGRAKVSFRGVGQYGLRDVIPIDNRVFFFLPDGQYEVASDIDQTGIGVRSVSYVFVVSGNDVVSRFQELGLKVNGDDLAFGFGSGWVYRDNMLSITNQGQYVLSGVSSAGDVQVRVAASVCDVILWDAIIYTQGRPTFLVDAGVTATLRMKGGVSHLAATNAVDGASVSTIEVNGALNVDFAPDAEQAQSAIYAFNFGEQPAIGGTGTVSVLGGHLCAWSDDKAIGGEVDFHIAGASQDKMIGQVGDSWSDVKLVGCGYLDESEFCNHSKVELAPAYWVHVPVTIAHVRGITVSNSWEALRHESVGALTNRYCGMLEDAVSIAYELEDGCVIVGANPQVIPVLKKDVVIGSGAYPLPDVRHPLTITLPEVLEGEMYVVREGGMEMEKRGGGGESGVAVYPVLSGYDIEIVCTAREGWRIVSEMNVITFANIQESKVLTAADLPQAWRLFTVTVPEVANATHVLTTDETQAICKDGVYTILSNAEVTVTFTAAANYRIVANGTKTWTLTGDVTFGTTEGFPLPMVEGIPGTDVNPWSVGENVQAYTNEFGELTITGTGAMDDFASTADVPWDPAAVTAVTVGEGVTRIGKNALAGIDEEVTVNGTALSYHHEIADAMGITAAQSSAGAISPAEFEKVAIIDGKAYLDVSVYTNSEVTVKGEGWGVATNGVITVPAPGKSGFFYLKSKPAVSDVVD